MTKHNLKRQAVKASLENKINARNKKWLEHNRPVTNADIDKILADKAARRAKHEANKLRR